jgi:ABC-type uncharacterized transport system substrate-binding protein
VAKGIASDLRVRTFGQRLEIVRTHLSALTLAALVLLAATCAPVAKAAGDTEGRQMTVGVLYPESRSSVPPAAAVLWRRLEELGWVEGRNLTIESRWADGKIERLPAYVAELLERNIDVLVTWTTPAAIAAKTATASSHTPVVIAVMADPVSGDLKLLRIGRFETA